MAVKTSDQWSAQIRSALATIDPTISTEVGDPIRKLIDAVSSVAAAIDVNSQVNQGFFDIDSKSGTDLDAIASWLGFGRRQGTYAVGEVRFYLDSPAPVTVDIPTGTQVSDGNVVFETVSATVINQYETEVTARVQATTVGLAGNVNAYEVNQIVTNFQSVSLKVENPYNMVGGTNTESDAELRKRIRQTFLRNVAGTEDAYRGIVDVIQGVTRVNVIGPIERWEEQLEVVNLPQSAGGGVGVQSMIDCSKFTWPRQSYLVKEPGTANERVFTPGVEYTLDTSYNPPVARVNMTSEDFNIGQLTGSDLDRVGAALGVQRYLGTQASGKVSFGFQVAQGSNYVIKKGTRVRERGTNHIFVTQADATIFSGSLGSSEVPVLSEEFDDVQVASGTFLDLVDMTGYQVEVTQDIQGGTQPWTDDYYRDQIQNRNSVGIRIGDFLFMKHEYCSIDSRNEPAENPPKVNKVDVFVDGIDSQSIRECAMIRSRQLLTDAADDFNVNDWYLEDNSHPANGTRVQVLGYAPVLRLPDSFNVNGVMYRKNQHYVLAKRQTTSRGSAREVGAICWKAGAPVPADGSFLDITYDFNRTMVVADQLLETNRQITTDVLTHEAHRVGIVVNLIVQNVLGVSDESMLAQVNGYLDQWCNDMEFSSWVQFSDIEMYVRQAMGVDACRVARKSDADRIINVGEDIGSAVGYGLQTVETFKRDLPTQHDTDFRLHDSHLPYIAKVHIVREASNTYAENPDGGSVGPNPPVTEPTSLTLDRDTLTLESRKTATVIATVTPSAWTGTLTATPAGGVGVNVTKADATHWNILISAGDANGTFTITVKAGSLTKYINVTVTGGSAGSEVTTLKLTDEAGTQNPITCSVGDTFTLKCTVTPTTWTGTPIITTSSPTAIRVGLPVRSGNGEWLITCTALASVSNTKVSASAGGKTSSMGVTVNGGTVNPPDPGEGSDQTAKLGLPTYVVNSVSDKTSINGQTVKTPAVLITLTDEPSIVYDDGNGATSIAKGSTDGLPVYVVNQASDSTSVQGKTVQRPCILVVIGTNPPQIIHDSGTAGASVPSAWNGLPVHIVRSASDRTSVHGQTITAPCMLIVADKSTPQIIYQS